MTSPLTSSGSQDTASASGPQIPHDQQRRPVPAAPVAAPEPHRQARPRLRALEGAGQRALGRHLGGGLQPVGAVVAVEHRHLAAVDRPLQVVLEELVGLALGLAELHGVGELGLGLLVATLLAAAPDHLVEGVPELGQLVGPANAELPGRLPVGHPGREPRVGPDPGHDVADQQQRDDQPDQRGRGRDAEDPPAGGPVGRLGPLLRLAGVLHLGGRHLRHQGRDGVDGGHDLAGHRLLLGLVARVEPGPDQPLDVTPALREPFQPGRVGVGVGAIGLLQDRDLLVDPRDDPPPQVGEEPRPVGGPLEQQQLQGRPGGVVERGLELRDGLGGEDVVVVQLLGPGVDRAEAGHRHPGHHHRGRQQAGQGQHQFGTNPKLHGHGLTGLPKVSAP